MATVSPYTTKRGRRWEVQWTRPDGRRTRKRGFPTKIAAQAWLEDQNTARRKGTWVDPTRENTRIDTLGERWLAMQTHLKPSGLRSIKSVWTNHVKPTWGQRTVGSIRRSEIQEWISTFPLGATSARRAHNALSQIFDLAVDDGCVAVNPAKGVRLPRKPTPVKVYLTMEQVRTLADESSQPAIVWFLATTGVRWSELAGLQVGDMNLSGRRAFLQRAAVTVGSRVEIGSLKSHESRSIAIPRFVCNLLQPIIAGRGADEFVWPGADGGPLRLPGHGSFFHGALERVRAADSCFPVVTVHGMRHVAAGLLVSSGASVKVVQRQLGHASAAMTLDTYADLFDGDLDVVADAMEVAHLKLGEPKVSQKRGSA
ncbi:site-specific integrase [Corynebacterium lactis]|uniref:Integrase n=1 Tax=Corynebacterium lactis RW2-5 TaxID=1408189 RepID=A0A0K2H1G3_9CORY|nr:site-specific integrase [Corynebacterium lactis]ALA67571.1 integrase [Corynebacterium lactis RW2-5]